MRRLLILLGSVAVSTAAMAAPASAKTPPFTVELSDAEPEAGERVRVTVRMWNAVNPRVPDTLYRPFGGELDGLLALVAAEDMEAGRPRPPVSRISMEEIALRYVRPATFEGSFVAPEHGDHSVVPWPRVILVPGAREGRIWTAVPKHREPTSIELTVRRAGRSPLVPVAAVSTAVAVAGAAALGSLCRRRRRPRVAMSPGSDG